MRRHRFVVGQMVRYTPGRFEHSAARGNYQVVRLLPAESADNQYRVKSTLDGHERVVRESQLQPR